MSDMIIRKSIVMLEAIMLKLRSAEISVNPIDEQRSHNTEF